MPEKPPSPPFVRERLQPGPSLPKSLAQCEQPFHSYFTCSSAPAPSVALHWTLSSFPVSLLNWGPRTGHCSTGLSAPFWLQWAVHHTILPTSTPLAQQGLKSCWTAYETSHCLFSVHSFQIVKIVWVCGAKVNLNVMDRIYVSLAEVKDAGNTDFQEGVCHNDLWLIFYLIKKNQKKIPPNCSWLVLLLQGFVLMSLVNKMLTSSSPTEHACVFFKPL